MQFFLVREITALLVGTEFVIFLVIVAYFSGYSVGYALADLLSLRIVRIFTIIFWAVHLTLPFSLRYWMGSVAVRLPSTAFIIMIFFTTFAVTSLYSLLLPKLIDLSAQGSNSLGKFYGVELMGAITGLAVVFFLGSISWIPQVLYQAALAAIVAMILGGTQIRIVAGAVALIYGLFFTTLEFNSLAYHYTKFHGLSESKVLYSVNSPYQKVDIVESKNGKRYMYLDGKKNYGTMSLKLFNIFLSQTPANLVQPENALALGAGSMESVKYIGSVANRLRIVDIDNAVPEGSKLHFKYTNHFDEYDNWTLTIEDAKSFLNKTNEYFDLITVDIPMPLQIQTGLLHSVEFYQMAKNRLSPDGVISISLSGSFNKRNKTPRTVAAALTQVFEEVIIHTPDIAKRSFAIAGRKLPFTKEQLVDETIHLGANRTKVYNKTEALNIIDGIAPITIYDLSYPLERSIRKVKKSYFGKRKSGK
ncbi:MAG: hypothetical protein ACE5D0_10540 [Fidelibacterota bacterium]